ncbi:MAG: phage major capsid protein [Pseudomonadota bacterium]
MTDHLDGMPETEGFCEPVMPVETTADAAASEFLSSFESFKDDVSERLGALDTRIGQLQTKAAMRRPALSTAAEVEPPHQKAFAAFLRRGEEEGLRALDLSTKGLNTQVNGEGGYLVDPRTSEMVSSVLRGSGSLRAISRVVQVEATAYDVLVDRAELEAGWLDEVTPATETTGPVIERISITLHELSANPRATQRILEDSAFDLEAWLAERIGDRFRRAEAAAFVLGTAANQPKGFLTKDLVPNGTEAWGELGYVVTGTSGGFDLNDPGDAIVDLVYALGAEYRANGTFVMNSKTAGEVRKMKDNQGRFLWVEGVSEDNPARLLGYPVLLAEDMPDIGPNSPAVAFGDFSRGYTIAERPDVRILRDPYSAKPNVAFFATKRVGGDVTDFSAIKVLRFGTS